MDEMLKLPPIALGGLYAADQRTRELGDKGPRPLDYGQEVEVEVSTDALEITAREWRAAKVRGYPDPEIQFTYRTNSFYQAGRLWHLFVALRVLNAMVTSRPLPIAKGFLVCWPMKGSPIEARIPEQSLRDARDGLRALVADNFPRVPRLMLPGGSEIPTSTIAIAFAALDSFVSSLNG